MVRPCWLQLMFSCSFFTWFSLVSSTVIAVIFHWPPPAPDALLGLCGTPSGMFWLGSAPPQSNSSSRDLLLLDTGLREFTFLSEVCLSSSASLSI